jgi:hypothetical protein
LQPLYSVFAGRNDKAIVNHIPNPYELTDGSVVRCFVRYDALTTFSDILITRNLHYILSETEYWLRSRNKNKQAYFVLFSTCTIFAAEY